MWVRWWLEQVEQVVGMDVWRYVGVGHNVVGICVVGVLGEKVKKKIDYVY